MTTTFALSSSIAPYPADGINPVADSYPVDHSLSPVPRVPVLFGSVSAVARVDTAEFSTTGTLVAAALSDSVLRTERLANLRQSIAHGTYRVSASTVAESLITAALETT